MTVNAAVLLLSLAVVARPEEAPVCFDEVINDDGAECFKWILQDYNLREHERINTTLSREGGKIIKACFSTAYGNSTDNCLNSSNFSVMVLCSHDNSAEVRKAFSSVGIQTRSKLLQIADAYRECLSAKASHRSGAGEGARNRKHSGHRIDSFFGVYRSDTYW
ncbi:uncharacterized protein LOC144135492 [Amblyomma americanum]